MIRPIRPGDVFDIPKFSIEETLDDLIRRYAEVGAETASSLGMICINPDIYESQKSVVNNFQILNTELRALIETRNNLKVK